MKLDHRSMMTFVHNESFELAFGLSPHEFKMLGSAQPNPARSDNGRIDPAGNWGWGLKVGGLGVVDGGALVFGSS